MNLFNWLFRQTKTFAKRSIIHSFFTLCLGVNLLIFQSTTIANDEIEHQVKAAFIYNFLAFTQWPDTDDDDIILCLYGGSHFSNEIYKLKNKSINKRLIKVQPIDTVKKLQSCQAIFFSQSVDKNLSNILNSLQNKPILTLADSQNAASQGVMINMNLVNEKIVFEINLASARKSGLDISSKLLQLAAKVY